MAKKEKEKSPLKHLGRVYELAQDSKLDPQFLKRVTPELTALTEYLGVTPEQAILVSLIFALNYQESSVGFSELSAYLGCSPLNLLEFEDDLEALCMKGLLVAQKTRSRIRIAGGGKLYFIEDSVREAIRKGNPMPELQAPGFQDIFALLAKVQNLADQRDREEISAGEMLEEAECLFRDNVQFPLLQKVNELRLDTTDAWLFLFLSWEAISGQEPTQLQSLAQILFDSDLRRVKFMQKFFSGENHLLQQKLITLKPAGIFNDVELELTDRALAILRESELHLFKSDSRHHPLIRPEEIQARELIFEDSAKHQLDIVHHLLEESMLQKTQERLQSKGLSKGILMLFHGAPGTGKTETALQLARISGREILKVDISQSKSMWFGESQKLIKRIFQDYREIAKSCTQLPILLFNEADGLVSRRSTVRTTVDQTENAIQNILLEEMENFSGILIATTNMLGNIDPAFERRFLFKVEFRQPDLSLQTRLWRLKFPYLEEEHCTFLSQNFDFSGGQIDNVLRKSEIYEIIHGQPANPEVILGFCREEKWGRGIDQIGFVRA